MINIRERNNHLLESKEFDCLYQLREMIDQYEQKATMYKIKYKQAKRKLSGEKLKTVLWCIEMKYESVKKAKKMHNIEYQCIK
jgi:hypothetical protein